MTGQAKVPQPSLFGPLTAIYGILLHQRDNNLSAFQRLMTLLCVKGNADDDVSSKYVRTVNLYIFRTYLTVIHDEKIIKPFSLC